MDYTLWPDYVDSYSEFLAKEIDQNANISFLTEYGNYFRPFINTTKLLKTLKEHCLDKDQHLAVASRATNPKLAMKAIEDFGWKNYFSSIQIYPTSKIKHMHAIQKELNLDNCEDFLFYDDDNRNIIDTESLGVLAYLVRQDQGFNRYELFDGLAKFNNRK